MGNSIQQVRAYVAEMLRASRSMLAPLAAHLRSSGADPGSQPRWVLERLLRTLNAHVDEMSEHLRRLGGPEAASEVPEVHHRREPASTTKVLRDAYGDLSLAHAGTLMLETNARALGFSSTAALARRHREELTTMLARVREVLPTAVKGEIEKEPIF